MSRTSARPPVAARFAGASGAERVVAADAAAAGARASVRGARLRPAAWARSRVVGPSAGPAPAVAVLCAPMRARAAAAGVALALARALGTSHALAGAVGAGGRDPAHPPGGAPAARRSAARLRERELPATASGRLVWLADRRGSLDPDDDVAPRAAASSAELGRASASVGAPAVLAIPLPRVAALDRVLAWHDAIVVVREPDASDAMVERALASLAALGRPVAPMAPPARLAAALAAAGVRVPAEAGDAVARLGLDGPVQRGR